MKDDLYSLLDIEPEYVPPDMVPIETEEVIKIVDRAGSAGSASKFISFKIPFGNLTMYFIGEDWGDCENFLLLDNKTKKWYIYYV